MPRPFAYPCDERTKPDELQYARANCWLVAVALRALVFVTAHCERAHMASPATWVIEIASQLRRKHPHALMLAPPADRMVLSLAVGDVLRGVSVSHAYP